MAVLNLSVYGPRTQNMMVERIHQGKIASCRSGDQMLMRFEVETRDGKKYNHVESSEEMKAKNKAFSRAHAMSIHLNLLTMGATVWYGFQLASRMAIVIA